MHHGAGEWGGGPDHSGMLQEDVFEEVSQLVQSALDGYKVCIFAYGQTGSGKTHTMMGPQFSHEQRGVIPRAVEQLYEETRALEADGWSFDMKVGWSHCTGCCRRHIAGDRTVPPACWCLPSACGV